jgi:MFS transporter, putative metabolite:H+ symporter
VAGKLVASADRAHPTFFWLGSAAVLLGVILHLPTFVVAAAMNLELVGMPMDWHMMIGMTLIVLGSAAAWYGLLPRAERRWAADIEDRGVGDHPGTSTFGSLTIPAKARRRCAS